MDIHNSHKDAKSALAFCGHRMEANIYEVSIQRESPKSLFELKL